MLNTVRNLIGATTPDTMQNLVPQSEPLNDRQVENNAGGYSFEIDDFARLKRFLILGSAAGTYYVTASKLTEDNAECVQKLLDAGRGVEIVEEIETVSVSGRAPKQSPGLFALAVCWRSGDDATKAAARVALPKVCRTASTLFEMLEYANLLGGISWGRANRRVISKWYTDKTPMAVAHQVTKYAQRNGWTHRDVLRLAHPDPKEHPEHAVVFEYAIKPELDTIKNVDDETSSFLVDSQTLKTTEDIAVALDILKRRPGILGWEHIGKTELLKEASLWGTLLDNGLPMTALVRNLVRMAGYGLLSEPSHAETVIERLGDRDQLTKSRMHPINLLQAHRMLKTKYPEEKPVISALDKAFYAAFGNIKGSNKRFLIGLDVSGSMDWTSCTGMSCLTARDAAAAMTLCLVKTEPFVQTMAFTHELVPLNITALDSLESVHSKTQNLRFGSTDCALPIEYALQHKLDVDVFVVLTDSETYFGKRHPTAALAQYRSERNPQASLAVLAFSATNISIADPQDKGMIDIAGMDTAVPDILRQFAEQSL